MANLQGRTVAEIIESVNIVLAIIRMIFGK